MKTAPALRKHAAPHPLFVEPERHVDDLTDDEWAAWRQQNTELFKRRLPIYLRLRGSMGDHRAAMQAIAEVT